MIGPGTGIAPMRALLQEREHQAKLTSSKGQNILFFGCRHRDIDYIYRDELEAYQSSGTLSQLHVAFSRDGNRKVYVQHLLADQDKATTLAKLVLECNAYIFVCGGMHFFYYCLAVIKNNFVQARRWEMMFSRQWLSCSNIRGKWTLARH